MRIKLSLFVRDLDDYEVRIIDENKMYIENVMLEKYEDFDANVQQLSLIISVTWNYQVLI